MQSIIVTIDAEGEIEVKAQGVAGSGCQALTAALERELGATTGDEKTGEFYAQQAAGSKQRAGR